VLFVFLVCAVSLDAAPAEIKKACAAFKKKLIESRSLEDYRLASIDMGDGLSRNVDVDIDGDGKKDSLNWFCPGSASIVPADPCSLDIKLSSGRTFAFEWSRFELVEFDAKVFVYSLDLDPRTGDIRRENIYLLNKDGNRLACILK
jgi:hypothetical protein